MNALDLKKLLSGNSYPGRGILLGKAPNGDAVTAYFIMGRSENSRNRVFVETDDGIRTQAYDESKMTDPSLIIYHPVRQYEGYTIVTNGDQTDTVRDGLAQGKSYIEALRTREFEPDGPNFTPRISGVVRPDGGYALSILKSMDGDPCCCERFFFEYEKPQAGTGHLIHTYEGDGKPLPSFLGEPRKVSLPNGIRKLTDLIWDSLNEDNRISLFVRTVDKKGAVKTIIRNKYR